MFTYVDHLVPVDEYAALCKVTNATIYRRWRKGIIAARKIDRLLVIDKEQSPPTDYIGYGVKEKAPPIHWPYPVKLNDLVRLKVFAFEFAITADDLFVSILLNELPAWGIGREVFIERNAELDAYVRSKRRQSHVRKSRKYGGLRAPGE